MKLVTVAALATVTVVGVATLDRCAAAQYALSEFTTITDFQFTQERAQYDPRYRRPRRPDYIMPGRHYPHPRPYPGPPEYGPSDERRPFGPRNDRSPYPDFCYSTSHGYVCR